MAQGLTTNTVQTGGGTVSAGTNITGFSAPVMFDRGASETPKPRVIKTQLIIVLMMTLIIYTLFSKNLQE